MQYKDQNDITPADVGQTNPPEQENQSGFLGYLGLQIGMWTLVVALAIVFAVVILAFAL